MRRVGLVATPVAVVAALVWLAATGGLARPAGAGSAPAAETVAVRRLDLGATVLATGVIRPQVGAEVAVGSRVSGVLERLHVTVGDRVRRGDVLAELDASELEARARQTAAALESARVELDFARRQFERARGLLDRQVIARAEFDETERVFRAAGARTGEAEAALETARIAVGYTRIRAPIGGVVASVSTQVGETVAASFAAPTFVTIIDLDRLEVWAYVDETDIGRVEVGQTAIFTVDTYPGVEFAARVTAIRPGAEVLNDVVNYIAVLEIGDPGDHTLRPEMTTTVNIRLEGRTDVLGVPNEAIRRDAEGTHVLVPSTDGPVRRAVRTGTRGRTHTEILEGLAEGERVVVDVAEPRR